MKRLEEIENRLAAATQKCYCNDLYAGLCKSCWSAMDLGRMDASDMLAVVKLQREALENICSYNATEAELIYSLDALYKAQAALEAADKILGAK